MADGTKLDHVVKQGSLTTASSLFTNILTAVLSSSIDKAIYIEAWVKSEVGYGATSNFYKAISAVGYGAATINLAKTTITNTIDPDSSGYDARISISGSTVQLQVHSVNDQNAVFYGYLSIHVIEYANSTPLTIFGSNLEVWLRSDLGVTVDGSNFVTRWADQSGNGNDFYQATSTNRPLYNAVDGYWNLPSITFDNSNDHVDAEEVTTTAAWKFLHDGTGGAICVVFRSNGDGRIANTGDGASHVGFWFYHSASEFVSFSIGNGSTQLQATGGTGTSPLTTNLYALGAFDSAASPKLVSYTNGVLRGSNSSAYTPSTANPTNNLRIGNPQGSFSPFDGEMLEVIMASTFPTATQLSDLDAYMQKRYLPTPPQIFGANLHTWLRSDLGITTVSGAVSAWEDQSGNGHNFAQSTVSARPVYSTSDSNWKNLPSLTFDGSNDSLISSDSASIWKFLHDGTGGGIFIVYRITDAVDATNIIAYTGVTNPGIRIISGYPAIDQVEFLIKGAVSGYALTNAGENLNTNQTILCVYKEGHSPEMAIYRGDTFKTSTSVTPGSTDPDLTLYIGGNNGTSGHAGDIVEVVIFDTYPSDEQIQQLYHYASWRYGIY